MFNLEKVKPENVEAGDQDVPPISYTLQSGEPHGMSANPPLQQVHSQYQGLQAQNLPYMYQQPTGAHMFDQHGQVIIIQPQQSHKPPPDFLCLNIFACLFCCCPIGIYGIIKSMETQSAIRLGDDAAAKCHSSLAKNAAIGAIFSGSVILVIFLIVKFAIPEPREYIQNTDYYG